MSGRRIRLLIWKEFLQLRRDPLLLRLLFIMPIAQLILFGGEAEIHKSTPCDPSRPSFRGRATGVRRVLAPARPWVAGVCVASR